MAWRGPLVENEFPELVRKGRRFAVFIDTARVGSHERRLIFQLRRDIWMTHYEHVAGLAGIILRHGARVVDDARQRQ
jgi:hypothetical protein